MEIDDQSIFFSIRKGGFGLMQIKIYTSLENEYIDST